MISAPRARLPIVLMAIILIGLILRGPIVAVAPIIGDISSDLSLTAAQAGLLTTLPVLCFALMTPFASLLVGRSGATFATTIAIVGVGIGSIVRSAGGLEATVTGTIIMGSFITIGNVVIPVIIRRDVPTRHVGIATGTYTAAMNVGSMITTLATAPLAGVLGWRGALVVWTCFVVVAISAWMFAMGPAQAARWGAGKPTLETGASAVVPPGENGTPRPVSPPRMWLSLSAVLLSLAFGAQALSYYGLTAWLPTILEQELGYSAGQAGSNASVFQIAAVIGALGVPLLSRPLGVPRSVALVAALWISCPLGLLIVPEGWLLWGLLGGIAQGGGITVIFMLVVQLALSSTHARKLSAMVQGLGYTVGATAPSLVGAVHDATEAWTLPLIVFLVSTSVFAIAGVAASIRATGSR